MTDRFVTPPQLAKVLLETRVTEAKSDGGWIFLTLEDGREVFIGCEYGQSLDLSITTP